MLWESVLKLHLRTVHHCPIDTLAISHIAQIILWLLLHAGSYLHLLLHLIIFQRRLVPVPSIGACTIHWCLHHLGSCLHLLPHLIIFKLCLVPVPFIGACTISWCLHHLGAYPILDHALICCPI